MNYELALQLKEAGFPQRSNPEPTFDYPTSVYQPSLEELIEAITANQTRGMFLLAFEKNAWSAQLSDYSRVYVENCSTPTEAVAKLWLALNPKKV